MSEVRGQRSRNGCEATAGLSEIRGQMSRVTFTLSNLLTFKLSSSNFHLPSSLFYLAASTFSATLPHS